MMNENSQFRIKSIAGQGGHRIQHPAGKPGQSTLSYRRRYIERRYLMALRDGHFLPVPQSLISSLPPR